MPLPMRTKTLLMGHFPSVWGATSGQVGRASPLRGLPATTGVVRRFLADSRAGSARDANKLAVLRAGLGNKIADLQDFYGSDGTRTRDLRRDRPAF
jgi:hypothetical protein